MCLVIENGMSVGTLLMHMLWLMTTHMQGYLLWYSFVSPIYAARFRSSAHVKQRLFITTIVACGIYLSFAISLSVLSVQGRDKDFNLVITVMNIVYTGPIAVGSCLGILYHVRKLRRVCMETMSNVSQEESIKQNMTKFLDQSNKLLYTIWIFVAAIVIASGPLPIGYFIWGTLPFAWVFYLCLSLSPFVMCCGYLWMDWQEHRRQLLVLKNKAMRSGSVVGLGGGKPQPPTGTAASSNNTSKEAPQMMIVAAVSNDDGTPDQQGPLQPPSSPVASSKVQESSSVG